MSDAELDRLAAWTQATRRSQYIAGRWQARALLRSWCGTDASRWTLTALTDGPPRLVGPEGATGLFCSLSHSADWLACAMGDVPVGIDVEATAVRDRNWLAMAQAVCSTREWRTFQALHEANRAAAFLAMWTLKESWLKRLGEPMTPGRMARLDTRQAPSDAGDAWLWQSAALSLALCAPGARITLAGDAWPAASRWRIVEVDAAAAS
ncbi:4'-phosphopantetheinyl transferase family protein [Xylophilus sp. GOD-11R]|uniref:4'-phosphopantetheinyl transferase family protein n=1 Tax=Xylophilus sp. GOD-11R TaxID=3089814 RepID=UPI00298C611C|nr:4'-phosphopantetheinyl transferase superfamily protein [Xylophilus sp. GOD-11R]WPB57086.1 4'-phosphopantetheinyl transferase superfamily protein [Xylophilus sp. GOD-11R]